MRRSRSTDGQQVLVTGGAGSMATFLRPRLASPGRVIRLLDTRPTVAVGAREEMLVGDLTDPDVVAAACAEVDAVVHLAGRPTEAPWESIMATNVEGTHTLLEACRSQGVEKIVLASSNHAVGLLELTSGLVPADAPAAPDSYYGFSKAAIEMLGLLYHQRYGMDVVCLRIGRCVERPTDQRSLTNWLSPDDAGRLVEAALAEREPAFRTVWGVSANTRSVFDQSAGEAIGFHPSDDAERYAADVDGQEASRSAGTTQGSAGTTQGSAGTTLVGGHFAERPLGG